MQPPAKVLAIGLDSADAELLRRLCDSGDLPVLESVRARGQWGPLRSPTGLADDGTWASFYTGVSPGRHGRYFFRAITPGSYATPRWKDKYLMHTPFWDVLSDAGSRIAVIDVPKCPLSTKINGIHVTDWLVHGRDHATASHPSGLASQLISRFGHDRTDCLGASRWLCDSMALEPGSYDEFLASLISSLNDKLTFTAETLERGGWDLFLVVFKEAHCAGHKFWHLQDSSHPAFSEPLAARYGEAVRGVYRRLDAAIGRLLEIAGPETRVIVFSDLGMASNYTGNLLLGNILHRLELQRRSAAGRITLHAQLAAVAAARRWLGRGGQVFSRSIRQFYALPNGEQSGAIRLNVVGREPKGIIAPGAEYDAVCDYLVTALSELVDPDSGNSIVDKVIRTRDIYHGPHTDRLPDLLVMWNRRGCISGAASELIGVIRRADPGIRPGGHIADGLYCLALPGNRKRQNPVPASIVDIAPTIADWLGHSLHDVDGVPISTNRVP
jgi:predicted AlkP superfamily phosphohydrolase/phosphomutase